MCPSGSDSFITFLYFIASKSPSYMGKLPHQFHTPVVKYTQWSDKVAKQLLQLKKIFPPKHDLVSRNKLNILIIIIYGLKNNILGDIFISFIFTFLWLDLGHKFFLIKMPTFLS